VKAPLHSKLTGRVNLTALRKMAQKCKPETRDRLLHCLRMCDDPTVYEKMLEERPLSEEELSPVKATFEPDDVATMTEHGFTKPQANPKVMCIAFTVLEEKMKEVHADNFAPGDTEEIIGNIVRYLHLTRRRRGILWPRCLNERKEILELPYIDLPSLNDQLRAYRPGAKYRSYDLVASFWQLPLSEGVSPYFSFADTTGAIHSMTVMPMGYTGACECLQAMNVALIELAMQGETECWGHSFVDNAQFGAYDSAVVDRVGSKYVSLCEQLGIDLNKETSNLLHTEHDFCGIHYRVTDASAYVKLPIGQLSKVQRDSQLLLKKKYLTVREYLQIHSRFLWASRVLHLDLAFSYYAIKQHRVISRGFANGSLTLKSTIRVWPSVIPIYAKWRDLLMANEETEVVHQAEFPTYLLATDSSKSG
jgi:hypothetical protein